MPDDRSAGIHQRRPPLIKGAFGVHQKPRFQTPLQSTKTRVFKRLCNPPIPRFQAPLQSTKNHVFKRLWSPPKTAFSNAFAVHQRRPRPSENTRRRGLQSSAVKTVDQDGDPRTVCARKGCAARRGGRASLGSFQQALQRPQLLMYESLNGAQRASVLQLFPAGLAKASGNPGGKRPPGSKRWPRLGNPGARDPRDRNGGRDSEFPGQETRGIETGAATRLVRPNRATATAPPLGGPDSGRHHPALRRPPASRRRWSGSRPAPTPPMRKDSERLAATRGRTSSHQGRSPAQCGILRQPAANLAGGAGEARRG